MTTRLEQHKANIQRKKHAISSYRKKADAKRNIGEKFADFLTAKFGSVVFLALNAVWFTAWVLINTGFVPGITPFDPFPFGLLTMVVSLEAIFLAIIVLISQNRASKVAEIREEVDLQINSISEVEVTKLINLMLLLLKKNGINVQDDAELAEMLLPINSEELEQVLVKELG